MTNKPNKLSAQERLKEELASKIYTVWNKSPEYDWEDLPDHRKQSYLDWVDDVVLPIFRKLERLSHDER